MTVAVAIALPTVTAVVAYRLGLRHGISMSGAAANHAEVQSSGCVDFQHAGEHTGRQACISGRVLRVFTSRTGNTFLDFCADYRNCSFTSIVFSSDRPKFGDLNTLQGRDIELRGEVRLYHNQPEIVVSDPSQIREAP